MNKFKLRELIDICNGTKYSHLKAGDVPLYGSGGVMSYVNGYLYDGEAILLPRKGTLSNIMYTTGKIWTVDTMYYATIKNDVDTYYLYSYLSILDLQHLDSGSALPSMTKSAYQDIEVCLPSLGIQKKIAAVLSALDAKIELNNRINAELEAMAKTLYDYWFVQFDFPDENGKPYKSSGGRMVYNETLKREIPDGWGAGYIGNILEKVPATKKISSKEILAEGMYPVIDQSMDYICGFTNEKEALIKSVRPHIIFGDHTRIVKLINFDFARGADGTQVLLSSDPRMPQHLFYLSLLKIDLSNYGYARHFKFLKETSIILPERNISERFEIIAQSAFNKIKHSTLENQQLTQLRDWLLPMLMNGQVMVK